MRYMNNILRSAEIRTRNMMYFQQVTNRKGVNRRKGGVGVTLNL